MVIYLGLDQLKKMSSDRRFDDFLDNLMTCYKEGKHIVIIEAKALIKLLNRSSTSDRNKKILEYYYSKFSTTNSIMNKIFKYVNITSEYEGIEFKSSKKIININFTNFTDSNCIQKSIILVENGNDGKFYESVAKYYALRDGLLNYKICSTIQTGGGNTISEEYKTIFEKKENFCLCLLDRDKKRSNKKNWGDTALRVVQYSKNRPFENLKCDYIILPLLEIENLVPIRFYELISNSADHKVSFDNLQLYLTQNPGSRRYIDFKRDTDYQCEFWKSYSCHSQTQVISDGEKQILFKSYGNKIIEKFNKLNFEEKIKLIKSDNLIERIWEKIGKYIYQFIIGSEPIRIT